jgi:glucose-6-phosphate dehydrogenase assembly protein OpcA
MTATPQPRPVRLRDVEQELVRQLKALQGLDERPVQRARMANLVIYCNSQVQADRIDADIPEVVSVHPARVLLLVADAAAPDADLAVTVHVRPVHLGQERYGFSEQVTLQVGSAAAHHLPFAVRKLLIGDLPTNLWWAAPVPPPLAGPLLYELGEPAQQIVYDSIGWPEPARGVAATATWLEQVERHNGLVRWRVASDLNWRRLKYWRRMLKQTLTEAADRGLTASVSEVLAEHGPHASVQAWELVSWLAGRLGWAVQAGKVEPGVEMVWHFRGPSGSPVVRICRADHGPAEVLRVRLSCLLEGRPVALNLFVEDGRRLAMQLEGIAGAPRTLTLPPRSPAELVGRQLSDRERDPVFRDSMAVAQVMARSILA